MAINPVSTATQSKVSNVENISGDAAANAAVSNGEAAVYEKSDQTPATKQTYTRDTVTLSEINKQVEMKLASFRTVVEKLITMQSVKTGEAQGLSYELMMKKYDGNLKEFYQNIEVDDSTRRNAQQELSQEGFWGVKQTSERAIAFAKALAGGDPSKIALLRTSIEEGYKAAEQAWGGELPEISKQTLEATLKGLEDWAKEAEQAVS